MKEENKPFNDVMDHFNRVEGNSTIPTHAKLNWVPKPLKYFGYFMIGFFSISLLLLIILNFLD